jgi:threonine dehydrogenase-like Zn-dependent dehydrogenase
MKAVTWQGKRDVRVEDVPDPKIEDAGDAVIEVTSTNICGSDLHLYEVLGAFMEPGDILGHEAMGIVQEVGDEVTAIKPGDRVVIPFQVSCGHCFMCGEGLYSQCETTQVTEYRSGATHLRVPHAQFTHIKVPDGPPDERFVYLSDVLPTAWQAVQYAAVPDGGTVAILGLGPIGDMAGRIAAHLGARVIGVDLVPERLDRARALQNVGVDRLSAVYAAIDAVRRGGTISLSGVYGGAADPLPMLTMFDKQIQLRMGQAHRIPLAEAPHAYESFQKKADGAVKYVMTP